MSISGKIKKNNKDEEVGIFSVEEICPRCGSTMRGDGERFECPECGVLFLQDGEYVTPWERSRGNQGECESCGRSLAHGDFHAPWEDGNNSLGYVKCPYCGHKNMR